MADSWRARKPPRMLDATALFDYALKSLAARGLSISELRLKLQRRAAEPGDIDQVIVQLKEYGYLNDAQLAENFAAARRDNEGFGKSRVIRDLRRRRVAPAVAENAVAKAYEGVDETAAIEQYLGRKYRNKNLKELLSEDKNLASAYRRLVYAGFSSGASIRVLKRYAAGADELETLEEEILPDAAGPVNSDD